MLVELGKCAVPAKKSASRLINKCALGSANCTQMTKDFYGNCVLLGDEPLSDMLWQ